MWTNRRNIRSMMDEKNKSDDDKQDEKKIKTNTNKKTVTNDDDKTDYEIIDTEERVHDDATLTALFTDDKTTKEDKTEEKDEQNNTWYTRYRRARKQLSTVRIVLFVGLILVNVLVIIYGLLFYVFDKTSKKKNLEPTTSAEGTTKLTATTERQTIIDRETECQGDLWRATGLVALLNSVPPLVSLYVTNAAP